MKSPLTSVFLLLGLATAPGASAVESKPATTELAATTAAALSGEFAGTWRAENDTNGALRITFLREKGAPVSATATFTFEGAEVPTTPKTLKIDGVKIDLAFGWTIQGVTGTSALTGELKGDRIDGTYSSTSTDGSSAGQWSATRTKSGS